jgi:hypothetical protein
MFPENFLTVLRIRILLNSVEDPDPSCHFDADPDPISHLDADPDPNLQFDADPDPVPSFQLKAPNLEKVLK